MAKRQRINTLRFLTILIIFNVFTNNILADSAWVLEPKSCVIGFTNNNSIKLYNAAKASNFKYNDIASQLKKLHLKKILLGKTFAERKITPQAYINRSKYLDKVIVSLNRQQRLYLSNYLTGSQHFYLEQGILPSISMGFKTDMAKTNNIKGNENSFYNFSIFTKHQVLKKKKVVISLAPSLYFEEQHSLPNPQLTLNTAYQYYNKYGWKYITQNSFTVGIDINRDNFIAPNTNSEKQKKYYKNNISQTLEFPSGEILQLSESVNYNSIFNYPHQYFFRNQLTVAKKFQYDSFTSTSEVLLSLGIYQDYFSKQYMRLSQGMQVGVLFKF